MGVQNGGTEELEGSRLQAHKRKQDLSFRQEMATTPQLQQGTSIASPAAIKAIPVPRFSPAGVHSQPGAMGNAKWVPSNDATHQLDHSSLGTATPWQGGGGGGAPGFVTKHRG